MTTPSTKHINTHRILASLPALVLALASARAANLTWTNTAGGNWSVAANWSPNSVPGASDTAVITNAGTYSVTVNAAVTLAGGWPGGGAAISKISTNGDVSTLFGGAQMNVRNPSELLFDAAGRLYISDSDSNQVLTTASPAAPTNLFSPSGAYAMAFDMSNRLAVSSVNSGVLRYYSTSGVFLGNGPSVKAGSPVIAGPGGDFWGRDLYAINSSDQLIRIDGAGNAAVAGTGFDGSLQMAFGPDRALYISYRDFDVILRIAPAAIPSPVHWWRGDGNALDSATGQPGTISNGVTYVPGRFGQAFKMDGTPGSLVELGRNIVHFGTNDFTVAFWFKTTSTNVMNPLS